MRRFPNRLLAALVAAALLPELSWAEPRLESRPWREHIRPPVLEQDTSTHASRAYPPDAIADSLRQRVQANHAPRAPKVDGQLDDWPLVRWLEIRGSGAVEQGTWSGPSDASCRFALLWTSEGLFFGGALMDDELGAGPSTHVTLMLGSSAPLVQRYWRSAERAYRLRADGLIEAWTRLRNRRKVPFDASALGATSGVSANAVQGNAGQVEFELFVPWDQLFPALPHPQAGFLVNVIVEDSDRASQKTLAWSTHLVEGKPQKTWSRLLFSGGPEAGSWLVSLSSRYLEPGQPCEWSVFQWGGDARPTTIQVRLRDAERLRKPVRLTLNSQPAIVRIYDIPRARVPWLDDRRLSLEIGADKGAAWRTSELYQVPGPQSFANGLEDLKQMGRENRYAGFPQSEDVVVRLKHAAQVAADFGLWGERIYHDTGILISREATWKALEKNLGEVDLLRDRLRGGANGESARQQLEALWPQRTAQGLPIGVPLLRGIHSPIDDSVQPYTLYISRAAAQAASSPLVVALHDHKQTEFSLFEETSLAQQVESHGWIAVCPYGRGDTGFMLAGERDVLDVIEKTAEELPVDARRLYATGFSMGGSGAWLLTLRHPELFAAASIVSAFGDMDQQDLFRILGYHQIELFHYETQNPVRLVRPDLETSYRIVHAEHDQVISVMHARIMADRLRQHGIAHEIHLPPVSDHSMQFMDGELGASMDFFTKHQRREEGWHNAAWFAGTGGPIASVFARGPFAVVYGTKQLPPSSPSVGAERRAGKSLTGPAADFRTADQFAQEWQSIFAGKPRVLPDTAVTSEMLRSHNLVLVGDPRTNGVLSRVASDLPVTYSGNTYEIEGRVYNFANHGIFFASANPAVPKRTLVVLSAMGERLGGFSKSLLKLGADFVVTDDEHNFAAIGHFKSFVGVAPRPRLSPNGQ